MRRRAHGASAFWLLIVSLAPPPSAAADPTLAEVVARAVERSPARPVIAVTSAEAAALSRRGSSWLAGIPSVALSHRTDAVGSNDGLHESIVALSLPVWLPGRRDARGRIAVAADLEARSAGSTLDWEVAGEVREAVWAVAIARTDLGRAERVATAALELEKRVERRSQAGELAHSDTILAREDTWRRRAEELQARSVVAQALSAYESLSGLTALPADFRERRAAVLPNEEDHPRLAATRARWARAEAEMEATRRDRGGAPSVTLGGQRERDARGQYFNESIIFGVSVPIGIPAQVDAEITRFARIAAEAERDHRAAAREVRLAIRAAELRLAASEAALGAARSAADLARESERMAERAFELGESDLVTLLLVRDRATSATAVAETRAVERDREIAHYNQALGVLP
ncbi:MAG: TolC family protein [Deltaproteobacteria bacterium]|nr:TolC family protein [Deltaproteobacteria bacterium]